jgi:hypothetical protein
MSFITMSDVLNNVKAKLGTLTHTLELDDNKLIQIIKTRTLKTLSVYFPHMENVIVNLAASKVHDSFDNNTFFIESKTGANVLGANRVLPTSMTSYSSEFPGLRRTTTHSLNSYLSADMEALTTIPYTVVFQPPNKINIQPTPPHAGNMLVEIRTEHLDFSSLNPNLYEYIMKLSEADIKLDILANRSFYSNLSTPFGDIELNLSRLEDAESARSEVIEKFEAKKHLNSNRRKIWHM